MKPRLGGHSEAFECNKYICIHYTTARRHGSPASAVDEYRPFRRIIAVMVAASVMRDAAFVFIFVLTASISAESSTRDVKEYCEHETFKASCGPDEVIVMETARYGRMNLGRCVKVDMGYLGCKADILDLVDLKCSGRRACEIHMPDPSFEIAQQCLELKSYLEVSYSCMKVLPADSRVCRGDHHFKLTFQSGRIASLSSLATSWCGKESSPWLIEVQAGQRINITLMDFNYRREHHHPQPQQSTDTFVKRQDGPSMLEVCHRYAVLKERSPHRSSQVCGGRRRVQHVYLSNGNVVEVYLESRRDSPDYFVLSYEAVGCPDPVTNVNTWFRRDNDEITMGCKGSNDQWRLQCSAAGQWIGDLANCSARADIIAASEMKGIQHSGLTKSAIAATVCIMAVIVATSISILFVVFIRRSRSQQMTSFEDVDHPPISPKSLVSNITGDDDDMYLRPTNGMDDVGGHCGHSGMNGGHSGMNGGHSGMNGGQTCAPASAHTTSETLNRSRDHQRRLQDDRDCVSLHHHHQNGDLAATSESAAAPTASSSSCSNTLTKMTCRTGTGYQKATNCIEENKYTHIWEMPLPIPGE